jgi:hypothetical protein
MPENAQRVQHVSIAHDTYGDDVSWAYWGVAAFGIQSPERKVFDRMNFYLDSEESTWTIATVPQSYSQPKSCRILPFLCKHNKVYLRGATVTHPPKEPEPVIYTGPIKPRAPDVIPEPIGPTNPGAPKSYTTWDGKTYLWTNADLEALLTQFTRYRTMPNPTASDNAVKKIYTVGHPQQNEVLSYSLSDTDMHVIGQQAQAYGYRIKEGFYPP